MKRFHKYKRRNTTNQRNVVFTLVAFAASATGAIPWIIPILCLGLTLIGIGYKN